MTLKEITALTKIPADEREFIIKAELRLEYPASHPWKCSCGACYRALFSDAFVARHERCQIGWCIVGAGMPKYRWLMECERIVSFLQLSKVRT